MEKIKIDNLMVAVDMGTCTMRGIVGMREDDGKVTVFASDSVPSEGIKRGVIYNVQEAAVCVQKLLKLLTNRINAILNKDREQSERVTYEISKIYVGLNGQTIRGVKSKVSRNLGRKEVTAELLEMLSEENKNSQVTTSPDVILDVVPQEFVTDDSVEINPVGCICNHFEGTYLNIMARRELEEQIRECFSRTCYKNVNYVLASKSTADAVLSYEEKELGCVLVDFGAGTTTVSVYYKNILRYLYVINCGGDLITKDISSLKLLDNIAEKLKKQCGSTMKDMVEHYNISIPMSSGSKSIESDFLADIIESRMDDILSRVMLVIEKSGYQGRLDKMVITGEGAKMKHLSEKLQLTTGMEVRLGYVHMISSFSNEKYSDIAFASVVGTLLSAEGECVSQVEAQVKKKKPGKKTNTNIMGSLFSFTKKAKEKVGEKFEDIFIESDTKIE